MKNLKDKLFVIIILIIAFSCLSHDENQDDPIFVDGDNYNFDQKFKVKCTKDSKTITYEIGDTPCWKNKLKINDKEELKIYFKVLNEKSEDLYERGYQELLRIKDGKVVEKMRMRLDEDAYWSEVPFIRVRKQKYLADLDGDGFLEFAVLPFSSGSAIWMTARIFSLKDKIEYWGKGRYQFEGDTFVQLGCPGCSKFNPEKCKKCH